MKQQLQEWEMDATTMFDPMLPILFGHDRPHCTPFNAAVQVDDATKESTVQILQPLCGQLVTVINNQLQEFLPGGQYHIVQDGEKREKLAHSHITNLLGEACFGDLDLSIYKRRNAACHHHATMNMLVRNQTMTSWFPSKALEEQKRLLQLSAKKAENLRRRHRQEERDVIAQRRLILVRNREEHDRKNEALMEKKNDIALSVMEQGGPCQTPEAVDHLIRRYALQKDKRAALQVQMNYWKTVMGHKSPYLKTSVLSVDALMDNLKRFLRHADEAVPGQAEGREQLAGPLQDGEEADHHGQGDAKEVVSEPMDVNTDKDISDSSDDEAESNAKEEHTFGDFVFTKTGEYVAVFCDNDFHIGCVTNIVSPDQARVNFLRKCTIANNSYVWPHKEEETISAMFVFSSGFEVSPRNGRVWCVPEHERLTRMYMQYKQKYT